MAGTSKMHTMQTQMEEDNYQILLNLIQTRDLNSIAAGIVRMECLMHRIYMLSTLTQSSSKTHPVSSQALQQNIGRHRGLETHVRDFSPNPSGVPLDLTTDRTEKTKKHLKNEQMGNHNNTANLQRRTGYIMHTEPSECYFTSQSIAAVSPTMNMEKSIYTSSDHKDDEKMSTTVKHRQFPSKRPIACNLCGKVIRADNFRVHLRSHTGEKPYKCPKCPFRSANPSSMPKHIKLHERERTLYYCQQCPHYTMHKSSLLAHKRTHHSTTDNLSTYFHNGSTESSKNSQIFRSMSPDTISSSTDMASISPKSTKDSPLLNRHADRIYNDPHNLIFDSPLDLTLR